MKYISRRRDSRKEILSCVELNLIPLRLALKYHLSFRLSHTIHPETLLLNKNILIKGSPEKLALPLPNDS